MLHAKWIVLRLRHHPVDARGELVFLLQPEVDRQLGTVTDVVYRDLCCGTDQGDHARKRPLEKAVITRGITRVYGHVKAQDAAIRLFDIRKGAPQAEEVRSG